MTVVAIFEHDEERTKPVTYTTKEFRGSFYILAGKGDPIPLVIGPFRWEWEAMQEVKKQNEKVKLEEHLR